MSSIEPLLTDKDAAKVLGVAPGTLRNWRPQGRGPAWVCVGDAIRYSPQAIRDYIETRTRRPSPVREVA